jgi:hypothetical protein
MYSDDHLDEFHGPFGDSQSLFCLDDAKFARIISRWRVEPAIKYIHPKR